MDYFTKWINGLLDNAVALNDFTCTDIWTKPTVPNEIFLWNAPNYRSGFDDEGEEDVFLEVEADDIFVAPTDWAGLRRGPDSTNIDTSGSNGSYLAQVKQHAWIQSESSLVQLSCDSKMYAGIREF